jgi:hypothetical protein
MVDELSFVLRAAHADMDSVTSVQALSTDSALALDLDLTNTTDGASVAGLERALNLAVGCLQDDISSRLAAGIVSLRIGGVRRFVDAVGEVTGLSASRDDASDLQKSRGVVPLGGIHVEVDADVRGEALSRKGRGNGDGGMTRTQEEKCWGGSTDNVGSTMERVDSTVGSVARGIGGRVWGHRGERVGEASHPGPSAERQQQEEVRRMNKVPQWEHQHLGYYSRRAFDL